VSDRIWLVRHGETEWSRDHRHTGSTSDIGLTAKGCRQGELLAERLGQERFAAVFTSPLRRARETCRLAGFDDVAVVDDDLREVDYGDYEGVTTAEIRETRPGWSVWTHDVPGGETLAEVGARADRVVTRVEAVEGDVAVFAHGHLLRILAARWLGLPPDAGRLLALSTATLSLLGYERETRVILRWNEDAHLAAAEAGAR
jgi:probable phosphoglycerate mutase